MAAIIVRNTTASPVLLEDLGVVLAPGEAVDLLGELGLSRAEIAAASHIETLVSDGTLVVNDGVRDLAPADGLRHIAIETVHEDQDGGPGLPPGGAAGQCLCKLSDADYDAGWRDCPASGPPPHEDIVVEIDQEFETHCWKTGRKFWFAGTDETGEPTEVTIEAEFDGPGYGDARLVAGKKTVLVTWEGIDMEKPHTYVGTLVNPFPAEKSLLRFQGRVSQSKGELEVDTITISFRP